ncbi:MAG: SCO family protein [Nitrospiraceae bacterium]|nr:SCO family protein [Nitrospiraceae bacterium]
MRKENGIRTRSAYLLIMLALLTILSLVFTGGASAQEGYTRTIERYPIPDVTLVNQEGAKVRLRDLLASDEPVLVDFIYTTCTTICPVLSANFSNFQKKRAPAGRPVRFLSLSIDPDNDTPRAMKAYLKRYGAGPGWDFLTGTREDVVKVLKAWNAFTQNKMNHYPLILIKSPSDASWVRIYGMIGTSELMTEFEMLKKPQKGAVEALREKP